MLAYLFPGEVAFLEGKVDEQQAAPGWPGSRHEDFASGEAIGRSTAAGIIARAQGDRFFAPFTGTVPICTRCWLAVPTPPAFATLGEALTFLLTSGSQFRPPPPPAFGSAEFIAGLAEVRQISDTRTPQQDAIAKFWALPAGTITPQGYWNTLGSDFAVRYHLSERAAAHALALMNMAAYDAIIASHDAKFTYWLIRPSQADPLITLAIGLPSFPSYPSNHATVSSAAGCGHRSGLRSVRDTIDLHPQPLARKLRNLDGGASRPVIAEHLCIHPVHVRKLRHVDEKNAAPEHVLQIGAGGAENRLHVAQALRRLGRGVGTHELTRDRIRCALAGHEDESIELDAWRVGADGCRETGCGDGLVGHGELHSRSGGKEESRSGRTPSGI